MSRSVFPSARAPLKTHALNRLQLAALALGLALATAATAFTFTPFLPGDAASRIETPDGGQLDQGAAPHSPLVTLFPGGVS